LREITGFKAKWHIFIVLLIIVILTAALSAIATDKENDSISDTGFNQTEKILAMSPNFQDNCLHIFFIDVGQGDSALIESSGHYLLIDAGDNDHGEKVVSLLKDFGVSRLDYVIATHPHIDHIGGLDTVIDTFDIETIIMPPVGHNTGSFRELLDAINRKELEITSPLVGTDYKLGAAAFTIITPVSSYGENLNNWSVGIKLIFGETAFILCGDIEKEAEADIIADSGDLAADVLKISHHGCNNSTSDEFLRAVDPTYAIISCGADNPYAYPDEETLTKLADAGITLYRTDIDGTIICTSNGSFLTWTTLKKK